MTTDAMALVRSLVLEDGRRWGEAAEPFQTEDAQAILTGEVPHHFLTRPRGASKTTDLAAVALGALLEQLPASSRSYAVAADRDQARLLVDAAEGFVARTDGLVSAVSVDTWRITAKRTGATLEVLAADGPSAYGLLPHLLIIDELAQWATTPGPRRVWEAVYSAAVKVGSCRVVVLTTAGDPAHWSKRILDHAKGAERWRVNEVPGPTPWIDPDALEEQKAALMESQYRRLHLNQWTAPEDRLAVADDLAACVTLDGVLEPVKNERYVVTLDVGLKNDRTVAAVTHAKRREGEDGAAFSTVLDRMAVWQGSRREPVSLDEVEAWIAQASKDYGGARVVADPYQAAQLIERLKARGVKAEEYAFTAQSVGRLAHRLYLAIRDHALELPDDEELLDELGNVRLRETSPGVYRMEHDSDKHDDRAVALALAVNYWHERQAATPQYKPEDLRAYGIPKSGDDLAFQRQTGADSWRWRS